MTIDERPERPAWRNWDLSHFPKGTKYVFRADYDQLMSQQLMSRAAAIIERPPTRCSAGFYGTRRLLAYPRTVYAVYGHWNGYRWAAPHFMIRGFISKPLSGQLAEAIGQMLWNPPTDSMTGNIAFNKKICIEVEGGQPTASTFPDLCERTIDTVGSADYQTSEGGIFVASSIQAARSVDFDPESVIERRHRQYYSFDRLLTHPDHGHREIRDDEHPMFHGSHLSLAAEEQMSPVKRLALSVLSKFGVS